MAGLHRRRLLDPSQQIEIGRTVGLERRDERIVSFIKAISFVKALAPRVLRMMRQPRHLQQAGHFAEQHNQSRGNDEAQRPHRE